MRRPGQAQDWRSTGCGARTAIAGSEACAEDSRLTGVAAWIWRAVFVLGLVIGGFTLFAYVVLWIFVPNEEL